MLTVTLDASDVISRLTVLPDQLMENIQKRATALAAQTHAHILERVHEKLHSTQDKYKAALHFKQVNDNTWLISLDRSAWWIEDGIPPNTEMIDWLLTDRRQGDETTGEKPATGRVKFAKDGSRYRVIPFKHNNAPTRTPESVKDLQNTIRSELKSRGIPYGKIEGHADGSPKIGLLHSFSITDRPKKTHEGPGQGWGLPGAVKQGPTGIPFLQGVRIYQRRLMDKQGNVMKDSKGKEKIQRDIMTFRIVSSKMKGTGRWTHPGLPAHKFLDEAYEFAVKEWQSKHVPEILAEVGGK